MESHYDCYLKYEEHLDVFLVHWHVFQQQPTDYSAAYQDGHCDKSMGKWKPTAMCGNEKNYI